MINSITGASLTDHTVDTTAGTFAGFLVRKYGRELGYVWTQGGVWHWRSVSGRNFGDRQKKHSAVQALVDAFAAYSAKKSVPASTVTLVQKILSDPRVTAPKAVDVTTTAAPARKSEAPVVFDSRPIVWADPTVGADLRNRMAASFAKIGAKQ